jgi:hypothetical protein
MRRLQALNATFLGDNLPVPPWAGASRSLTANLRTPAASTCLAVDTDRRALAVQSRKASAVERATAVIRAEGPRGRQTPRTLKWRGRLRAF